MHLSRRKAWRTINCKIVNGGPSSKYARRHNLSPPQPFVACAVMSGRTILKLAPLFWRVFDAVLSTTAAAGTRTRATFRE